MQLQQEVLFALARRTEDLIDYRKLQIVLQSADLDLKTKTNCSRAQEAVEICPLSGSKAQSGNPGIEASMFRSPKNRSSSSGLHAIKRGRETSSRSSHSRGSSEERARPLSSCVAVK